MASDIKIVYHNNVFAGSGAPADGDLLTRDNSSHPKDSVYIDRDSGTVYVRKDTTLIAATDWQSGSGGSGGGTSTFVIASAAPGVDINGLAYSTTKASFIFDGNDATNIIVTIDSYVYNMRTTDAYTIEGTPFIPTDRDGLKTELLIVFTEATPGLQKVLDEGTTLNKDTEINVPTDFGFRYILGDGNAAYADLWLRHFASDFYTQNDDGSVYVSSSRSLQGGIPAVEEQWSDGTTSVNTRLSAKGMEVAINGNYKTVATVKAADDFANDAAAASGGIAAGQFYHTSGTVKIRLV